MKMVQNATSLLEFLHCS